MSALVKDYQMPAKPRGTINLLAFVRETSMINQQIPKD